MRSSWSGGALNPVTSVLRRSQRGETQTQGRSHVKTEAEMGGTRSQAQGRLGHQKLEEAGRTLPWSPRREPGPAHTLILESGLQIRFLLF